MRSPILINGDCLEIMPTLEKNSVDAIVTDPPYGLSFMGKSWDHGVPGVEFWKATLRVAKPGAFLLAFGGTRTHHRLTCAIEDAGFEIRDCMMWIYGSGFPKSHNLHGEYEGWGTALKPAWEPIIVARKPLEGTVAENVLKWGCGAMNIDDSRVEIIGDRRSPLGADGIVHRTTGNSYGEHKESEGFDLSKGRWPANAILDEEAGAMLDGGASRFFYCAKASKSERGEGNNHPTVKPISLLNYLLRLVCQPGGIVLDPFMGSGSTGIAAQNFGFKFIGIEREKSYCEIADARINTLVVA